MDNFSIANIIIYFANMAIGLLGVSSIVLLFFIKDSLFKNFLLLRRLKAKEEKGCNFAERENNLIKEFHEKYERTESYKSHLNRIIKKNKSEGKNEYKIKSDIDQFKNEMFNSFYPIESMTTKFLKYLFCFWIALISLYIFQIIQHNKDKEHQEEIIFKSDITAYFKAGTDKKIKWDENKYKHIVEPDSLNFDTIISKLSLDTIKKEDLLNDEAYSILTQRLKLLSCRNSIQMDSISKEKIQSLKYNEVSFKVKRDNGIKPDTLHITKKKSIVIMMIQHTTYSIGCQTLQIHLARYSYIYAIWHCYYLLKIQKINDTSNYQELMKKEVFIYS